VAAVKVLIGERSADDTQHCCTANPASSEVNGGQICSSHGDR
jgi:hypothetical protein